jgi:DNA repair protein RadC
MSSRSKPLAKRPLTEFGSFPALLAACPADLARVEGLSDGGAEVRRGGVAAVVVGGGDRSVGTQRLAALLDYLHAAMAHRVTEEFRVTFLDHRNIMIRDEPMGAGTINAAPVYPREIVKRALELGASGLVLVHNHPIGDPSPSRDDIAMIKAIVEAGCHLGLSVHDHVVIGSTGHASFRQLGLL